MEAEKKHFLFQRETVAAGKASTTGMVNWKSSAFKKITFSLPPSQRVRGDRRQICTSTLARNGPVVGRDVLVGERER
jgi:hypothetical protein